MLIDSSCKITDSKNKCLVFYDNNDSVKKYQ